MQAVSREQRASSPRSAAERKKKVADGAGFALARTKNQNPAAGGEEKCEAIGASGDVVDGRAVDGMHGPEERAKERQAGKEAGFFSKPFWFQRRSQQALQKKKQRDRAPGMEEQIGEMKTEGVGMPEKVIDDEREVLHRPIMPGERIGKEVMPKDLEREQRAFDEGAVAREKGVVPDKLAGERRRPDQDADDQERKGAQPMRAE